MLNDKSTWLSMNGILLRIKKLNCAARHFCNSQRKLQQFSFKLGAKPPVKTAARLKQDTFLNMFI